MQFYVYRWDVYNVILLTGVSYLLMLILPRSQQHKYVMAWVLGSLCYNHAVRMYNDFGGYGLDISTFTMCHVCKMSALAFCYKDGGEKEENLTKEQIKFAVKDLPSLLELCSYTWYVSNCTLGVFFEFSDYKRFIEEKDEYAKVPSTIVPALKYLLTALTMMGLYVVGNAYFPMEGCYAKSFAELSLTQKFVYYYMAMTVKKVFYYGPFSFTTGSIIASGLGYNGGDRFDKIVGVYILGVELAYSTNEMFICWNHQIHLWLKFYI